MNLLLHICCGPCSIMPLKFFSEAGYKIEGFYHNPNIQPLAEYLRRREGVQQCAARFDIAMTFDDASWNIQGWLKQMLPHAASPKRCEICIDMRLRKTAQRAKDYGYSCFSTTLLYSRYQPHEFIRTRGMHHAAKHGLEFIYHDFRQYWQEGIDISKEWAIYRQPYCGCIFGEAERYAKKLQRLAQNAQSGM